MYCYKEKYYHTEAQRTQRKNKIKGFGKVFEKEPFIKRFVSIQSGSDEKKTSCLSSSSW
jgi:hypothetical protein